MIQNGADVNAKEIDGWTPLHLAAQNGTEAIAQTLIRNNATIDINNNDNVTPIFKAIEFGTSEEFSLHFDY